MGDLLIYLEAEWALSLRPRHGIGNEAEGPQPKKSNIRNKS
jgi:hypothetical protein